jgi:hypothetical protein
VLEGILDGDALMRLPFQEFAQQIPESRILNGCLRNDFLYEVYLGQSTNTSHWSESKTYFQRTHGSDKLATLTTCSRLWIVKAKILGKPLRPIAPVN